MPPHSSTLAWKIPWMEEPGKLQSMGSLESDMTEWLHFHFILQSPWQQEGKTCLMSCVLDSSSPSNTPDPSILYKGEKGQSLQDSVFLWYFQSNSWASFNSFGLSEMFCEQAHMINDGAMPSHFFRVLVEQQVWSCILIAILSYHPEYFILPQEFYTHTHTHTQTNLTQNFNTMWKEQS